MTGLARFTRRAWAAFLGGTGFGFGFLFLIDPLGSRLTDAIVLWAAVALGAVSAVLLTTRIERALDARGATAPRDDREGSSRPVYARAEG